MFTTSFSGFAAPPVETKLDSAVKNLKQRFPATIGGMPDDGVSQEFYDVLAAKQIYGPRLWDTPGVVALQVGLSEQGRPLLDVVVSKPGDIPKIPKFLTVPASGGIAKVRARAVGFALNLPKPRLAAAQTKLDNMLYNIQGYRTAGITYVNGKPTLAAVLLERKDGGQLPAAVDGFPIRVFYLA